jgi:hypothetical protein
VGRAPPGNPGRHRREPGDVLGQFDGEPSRRRLGLRDGQEEIGDAVDVLPGHTRQHLGVDPVGGNTDDAFGERADRRGARDLQHADPGGAGPRPDGGGELRRARPEHDGEARGRRRHQLAVRGHEPAAQLPGQLDADDRVFGEQHVEVPPVERPQGGVGHHPQGGGTRLAQQEGQLTHETAGAESGQRRLIGPGQHLDLTRHHQIHRLAGLPLPEDHVAAPVVLQLELGGHRLQRPGRQIAEEGDRPELLFERLLAFVHRHHLVRSRFEHILDLDLGNGLVDLHRCRSLTRLRRRLFDGGPGGRAGFRSAAASELRGLRSPDPPGVLTPTWPGVAGARLGDLGADGGHDAVGRLVDVLVLADQQRRPDRGEDRQSEVVARLVPRRFDPLAAPDADGHDRHPCRLGQAGGAGLSGPGLEVAGDAALREDPDTLARLEVRLGGAERRPGRLASPLYRDVAQRGEEPAGKGLAEELGHGQEPHPPTPKVAEVGDDERVEEGDVVGGEHHRPVLGDVLHPGDAPFEAEPDGPPDGVDGGGERFTHDGAE